MIYDDSSVLINRSARIFKLITSYISAFNSRMLKPFFIAASFYRFDLDIQTVNFEKSCRSNARNNSSFILNACQINSVKEPFVCQIFISDFFKNFIQRFIKINNSIMRSLSICRLSSCKHSVFRSDIIYFPYICHSPYRIAFSRKRSSDRSWICFCQPFWFNFDSYYMFCDSFIDLKIDLPVIC